MKKVIGCILLVVSIACEAQEKLAYQSSQGVVEFNVSPSEYFVRFLKEDKLMIANGSKKFIELSESTALISVETSQLGFRSMETIIRNKFQGKVLSTHPVLIYKDGIRQVSTGEIIVRVRQSMPEWERNLEGRTVEVTQDQFNKKEYILKFDTISTPQLFLLVNMLNRNESLEFAEPNFIRLLKPFTNDPFLANQWSIDNQGYFGGVVGADMKVLGAWQISTGQGIKIAIIDEGVDLNHPDLVANLLTGYDATGGGSNGAPNSTDPHGTNCAGVAAAVANNSLGIAGVAYNAKIMPIRIAYRNANGDWVTDDIQIKNGIDWATNHGANILSCSWGGGRQVVTLLGQLIML